MPKFSDTRIRKALDAVLPPVVRKFGGTVEAFNIETRTITMRFQVTQEYCHSEIIVQGGILTTMLDAAMAYVVVGMGGVKQTVATLELKMNFMAIGNPGEFVALGKITHQGRTTVFMEGELYQRDHLIATSSATGKLVTPRHW